MNRNVSLSAVSGMLSFMAASFVLTVLGLTALHALVVRRYGRWKLSLLGLALVSAVYFGLVLAFSLASEGRVLARGEEKYFCEVDCHLAYSVAGVRRAKTLGAGAERATARGEFLIVTLRARFDETTISPRRGDKPLRPNPRRAAVRDAEGNSYAPSEEGRRGAPARHAAPPRRVLHGDARLRPAGRRARPRAAAQRVFAHDALHLGPREQPAAW